MALTDVVIRALKPPDKVQKISDGEGLQLWVMPVGSRLWRYAFWPAAGFVDTKALLASGSDPSQQ